MALVEYRLAETLDLPDGRTVEWEVVGDGQPADDVGGGWPWFLGAPSPT